MKFMTGTCSKTSRLYIFNCEDLNEENYANNVSTKVWHRHLGHSSFKKMNNQENGISCIQNITSPCYIFPWQNNFK